MTKYSTFRRHSSLFAAGGAAIELGSDRLVIRLPDPRLLQLIARYVLLVVAIMSLPWFLGISTPEIVSSGKAEYMPTLIDDLKHQGLMKRKDRVVFLRAHGPTALDNSADFVFAAKNVGFDYVDSVLKTDGVVAVELGTQSSEFFRPPENYRLSYVRRIGSATIVAMKKLSPVVSGGRRRLMSVPEAKKEALNRLEDALLEPPVKLRKMSWKRTRYLPDLTGDKLDKYPRRVFVDVVPSGQKAGGAATWFQRHYPKKNSAFEIIQLLEEDAEQSKNSPSNSIHSPSESKTAPSATVGIAEWLERNVKEEEYVVVKAEAEAVEEVVESGAVKLVDELFLECKHQWGKGTERSRRAYWQCLALYGKLRDEGVAVHQWWGA